MCGIIGFCGNTDNTKISEILIEGLKALEYRGYDSAGISVVNHNKNSIETVKTVGRLACLEERLRAYDFSEHGQYRCGIGHTRWATHGEPSDINSHPHATDALAIVHNGIIENYMEIKEMLQKKGYSFESETDTEAALKLIDYYYKNYNSYNNNDTENNNAPLAIFKAVKLLRGSFALGIVFSAHPDKLYAIRHDSPLIVTLGENGSFISSDVTAILPHTHEFYRLPENTLAVVYSNSVEFFRESVADTEDIALARIELQTETVNRNYETAQKDGCKHFMLKEIFEEPSAIRKTVLPRLLAGIPCLNLPFIDNGGMTWQIENGGVIHIVACGTAMHAGLIGKILLEKYPKITVNVEIASEFRYRNPILKPRDIVILLSQSGETADTLASLRYAKAAGLYTLALVNVPASTVAREADDVLYTFAGPEIAVASTKAYSVQCALLCLIAVKLALLNGRLSTEQARKICTQFEKAVPEKIEEVLSVSPKIREAAAALCECEHMFYIGRGIDYALCVEGSLKLKEISYIHSEAYAAGELKHGTISLIEKGVYVIALITDPELYEKMISGIREVSSRGGKIIAIVGDQILKRTEIPGDILISLPSFEEDSRLYGTLTLFPAACALQLLAYHVSDIKGLDVDKPRNLAKSVTVE